MKKKGFNSYFYVVFKYMILFALIPLLLLFSSIGYNQIMNIKEDVETTAGNSLNWYVDYLSSNLMVISNNLVGIASDGQIIDILKREKTGVENFENELIAQSKLYNLNKNDNISINYFVVSQKGNVYKSQNIDVLKKDYGTLFHGASFGFNDKYNYHIQKGSSFQNNQMDMFLVGEGVISNKPTGEMLGRTYVEVNLANIPVIDGMKVFDFLFEINEGGEFFVVGSQSSNVEMDKLSSHFQDIKYWDQNFGVEIETLSKDGYLTIAKREPHSGLIFCGSTKSSFYKDVLESVVLMVIFVSIVGFLILVLASKITKTITLPIEKICQSIDKVSSGDLEVILDLQSSSEFQLVSEHFNKMVVDIKKLIQQVYSEQSRRRKTELMLLQAQINPHFLYNTLDSIIWLIRMERYDDGIKMINALTSFLRTGLNKGKEVISLEEEIQNVKSYLRIQKLRYQNAFSYEIDFADSILTMAIPKLILQPIVENAIYHGVKNLDEKGYVHIYGYQKDSQKIIVVADTGSGMTKEKVDELLDFDKSKENEKISKSYGLINVIERLKLFYKDKVEFLIESEEGKGTTVTIKIEG